MMNDLPTQRIAAALRFLATEAKLSQEKLAERAGMSQSAVNRKLSGTTSPTIEDLDKLAEALGYQIKVTFEPLPTVRNLTFPNPVNIETVGARGGDAA